VVGVTSSGSAAGCRGGTEMDGWKKTPADVKSTWAVWVALSGTQVAGNGCAICCQKMVPSLRWGHSVVMVEGRGNPGGKGARGRLLLLGGTQFRFGCSGLCRVGSGNCLSSHVFR